MGLVNVNVNASDFITRWDLSKTGGAGNNNISFYTTNAGGSISYTWHELSPGTATGSGTFAAGTAAHRSILSLPANAIIELRIAPTNLQRFYINGDINSRRLVDVTAWGSVGWTSMEKMFLGCIYLGITSTDVPDLSNATSMREMFSNCASLNGPANIDTWNTSTITNMQQTFEAASAFNQNISGWNVSNVTNMRSMFTSAAAFNQNLGQWTLKSDVNLTLMLDRSGLNCDNYSRTLALWGLSTSATKRQLGALGKVYGTNVSSLRNELVGTKAWSILDSGTSGTDCGPVVYFSKSTGNLNDLTTWGVNMDGTGNSPINFTSADQIFAVRNRSTAALSNNWTVSGSNSMVVVGDGTSATVLNTGNNLISGTFKIANNSTLDIASNSTAITLFAETGSTVNYSGTGAQTIAAGQYHNINISNNRSGSTMTLASGNITVRGTMTHTLTNAGSWVNTGNTFRYSGTGAQTIAPINYNNLTVEGARSGSPSITLGSGTVGIAGSFTNTATGLGSWVTTGNTVDYNGVTSQQILPLNYNNLTISGNRNNGNITLPGGTIRIAGTLNVSASEIGGWTNTGNTIEYNGTSSQTVSAAIPYQNLSIGGSGSKTLDGNTTVAGDLTLNNKLTLGDYNLTLSGAVVGASSINYVQTNGSGAMKKSIGSGATFTFPIGNSAYNPVSIANNTGAADVFSARVLDEVYYGGVSGKTATEPRVRRTWNIGKTNPNAGSGVNMTFNWNAGEETTGITSHRLYNYNAGAWQMQTGTTSVSGTSLTYTGFTGNFSSFAIGDNIVVLPVTWLSMHCRRVDAGSTELKWATTGEINSGIFEVLRRTKSGGFNVIGHLNAAAGSHSVNQYLFMDMAASGSTTDYQIRLITEPGSISTSDYCSVPAFSAAEGIEVYVYPNPAESVINVLLPNQDMPAEYSIYEYSGQQIKQGFVSARNSMIPLSSINPGLYILQIKSESGLHCEKIWVK